MDQGVQTPDMHRHIQHFLCFADADDSGDEDYDDGVHYCDSHCDHSEMEEEEEVVIDDESEGASEVEDDDEIHECDSDCDHSEYEQEEEVRK